MKKAVIVATPDAYANGVKPKALRQYFEANGFVVELLPSAQNLRIELNIFGKTLPMIKPFYRFYYVIILKLLARVIPHKKTAMQLYTLARNSHAKSCARVTHMRLQALKPDVVVCETSIDSGFVMLPRVAKLQVLDLPCPWAEELYFGGSLTERSFEKMKLREKAIYAKADALSFHWHTYSSYVKKTKYNGLNIIDMGYGVEQKNITATYSQKPRIIFLGVLDGYWVNTDLLEALCVACPEIDVYGGPKPPTGSKINYIGYAPSLDVMAEYQFGLITISDDELRQNSFSSKHLEYISYGLPVFTPRWRKDDVLEESSIYYDNVQDFLTRLKEFSSEESWNLKRRAALSVASRATWGGVFEGLTEVMEDRGLL